MSGQRTTKLILVVFISLIMAACSSSGWTVVHQPLSQKILPGKSVSLSVKIDTTEHQKDDDYKEMSTRIRDSLFAKLASDGIFKSVLLSPEPADYGMDVTLTVARVVSGASRVWNGVMAGHNDIQMTVQVFNRDGNQKIADFEVDGTSASHPMSSENRPDDAIREATNQIIQGLR